MTDEAEDLIKPICDRFIEQCRGAIAAAQNEVRTFLRVRYDPEPCRIPSSVPAPRLQLRWQDGEETICHYELVFPLRDADIRNEANTGYAVIELGRTTSRGGGAVRPWERNPPKERMPYRDGAHASWDAKELRLPVFVIAPDGTFAKIATEDLR